MESIATTAPMVAETMPEPLEPVTEAPEETTVETTVETIPETEAPPPETETAPVYTYPSATDPTQIIEVIETEETYDYITVLGEIADNTALSAEASAWSAGFDLFFVVVALCYFVYKFFRIFF